MTIHDASELQEQRPQIDLNGPDGNAFALTGMAKDFASQLGYSKETAGAIVEDMLSSDYEHLLDVFEKEFGEFVDIYR